MDRTNTQAPVTPGPSDRTPKGPEAKNRKQRRAEKSASRKSSANPGSRLPNGNLQARVSSLENGIVELSKAFQANMQQITKAFHIADGQAMVLQRLIRDVNENKPLTFTEGPNTGKINIELYYDDYNKVNAVGKSGEWARGGELPVLIKEAQDEAAARSGKSEDESEVVFGGDGDASENNESNEAGQRDGGTEGREHA